MYVAQRENRADEEAMRKSQQFEKYKSSIMSALDEQKEAKTRENIQARKERAELDRQQLDYTIAKDNEWQRREDKKNAERKQHALNLMLEANEKQRRDEALGANGAKRGQKMTKEEQRLNRELLKEVSKIKKEGNFNDLYMQCTNKKVTSGE